MVAHSGGNLLPFKRLGVHNPCGPNGDVKTGLRDPYAGARNMKIRESDGKLVDPDLNTIDGKPFWFGTPPADKSKC